ncbi:hypothetical protein ACVIGA_000630 [Bradyrhizobium sp. USDA 3240]
MKQVQRSSSHRSSQSRTTHFDRDQDSFASVLWLEAECAFAHHALNAATRRRPTNRTDHAWRTGMRRANFLPANTLLHCRRPPLRLAVGEPTHGKDAMGRPVTSALKHEVSFRQTRSPKMAIAMPRLTRRLRAKRSNPQWRQAVGGRRWDLTASAALYGNGRACDCHPAGANGHRRCGPHDRARLNAAQPRFRRLKAKPSGKHWSARGRVCCVAATSPGVECRSCHDLKSGSGIGRFGKKQRLAASQEP